MIDRAIVHLSPRSKRILLRWSARRLIGGETLESACDLCACLNVEGKRVTLGLLGEDVESEKAARSIAADERRALEEIEARRLESGTAQQQVNPFVSGEPLTAGAVFLKIETR
ncbi:MAG: hypothetical protein ABSC36_03360 [Gaiellaceae bacterium]